MASKVDSIMSTSVALETLKASNSINSLTKAVRGSTSAWKAQEAQLKSSGDYLKASEAKYEGLGKSIEAERKRIEVLQEKMKDLDQTTQDGAKQAVKYGNDLDKATTALKSMEAQQQRAHEALQREKSGINSLNSSMRQRNSLSKAVSDRLEAEGKHEQALKEKRDNARKSIDDISKALKKEEALLKDLEKNNGSASAINKQRIAVEKLKASMAASKSSVSKFDKSIKELNPSPIQRLSRSFSGLKKEGKETHSVFKQVFSGVFWGEAIHGAVSQAFNTIKMGFGGIIKAGNEFNKEQQVMNATWTTLTGSASKGEGFVKSINKMSTAFGQSSDLVNELDQQFYHVLDKKEPTEQLTKSVLTMADTLGLSAENTQRLGLNFTHMMSSSKMQLGDFNMISDQLPMFGERLLDYERKMQHNNALSMSELRKQMSAGKISAKDAEAVMNGLGKKYKDASENMMKTAAGAERSIKTRFSALSGDLAKPFTTMQSPIFEAVSKWVSDPKTEKKFTEVGKAASKGFQTITTALTKALDIKNSPKAMNNFMDGLAKSIKSVSDVIASHSKQIVDFFQGLWSSIKIIGSIGVGFFKGLIGGLGAVVKPLAKMTGHSKKVKGLSGALGELSKHKSGLQTLGRVLAGVFITSKVLGFASAVKTAATDLNLLKGASTVMNLISFGKWSKIVAGVKDFTEATKGASLAQKVFLAVETAADALNPFGWIALGVAAVAAIGAGFYEAYKHIKPFRDAVNGVGTAMKKLFTGKYGWEKSIGKKLASVGSTISKWARGAGKFVSKHKTEILAGLVSPFAGLSAWFLKDTKTGNSIQKWAGGFNKDIQKMGFKKAMDKQVNDASKAFSKTKFGKWFKTVSDSFNSFKKSFRKSWNRHWSDMGKSLRNNWNSSVKNTRNFFSTVGNKWNGFKNGFRKSWNSHWNAMTRNLHSAWNSSYKHTRDFFSSMGTKWAGWKKSWSRSWNNHWDTMRANLHNYWNKDLSHTRSFGRSMGDWLGGFRKSFSGGWSSLGTGVENIFRGLWSTLKRLARDGMNDVIDLINGGINAVDSVIHAFGGKRKTIADLGHVHFATGTGVFSGSRNPITKPTLAMLNDGNDSPQTGNKEMVMLPNGDSGIVQGRNTKMMLPAGTEVLSASETAMLMSMQGVTKYAKGTGFFGDILNSVTNGISGVTNWVGKKVGSLERFFKTATNIIAHPIKSLENLFSWSSKGVSGVMSNIGHGLFNGVKKQAKTWWSTLWNMVDLNGGGSYGGGWQSPGSGWTHTDGFGSPRGGGAHDGNDFSARVGTPFHAMHGGTVIRVGGAPAGWGPVGYNIVTRDSTGKEIIYQEFGNAKDVRVHKGQHVKTGDTQGVLGHSGLGTGPHLHVGLTNGGSVWGRSGMSTSGWLDITKQHGKDKGSDADSDTNNSLQKIIKKQVGGGFWKFISKLADMFGDDGGSGTGDPGGAGVQRWKSDVKSALSKLGLSTSASMVSRVLRQINTESGGNPKAMVVLTV